MKNQLARAFVILTSVFYWNGTGSAAPTTSTLYVGQPGESASFGGFQALPTQRSILTIDTNGATKLRVELPPLLAGLPLQTLELTGQFDTSSHSVTVSGAAAHATCTLAGPGETMCEITFAEDWIFDSSRGKSYVRTRGFGATETAGREAVIDEFAAQHRALLKVRTRILL